MDSEKQPPSRDTLPAFRVRQTRASLGDAVIRMKKKEYDELLRKEPKAALRYIDESDGEVILVGSSLELDQRLQEPLERAARAVAGVPLDLYGAGPSPMHSFDVVRDATVIGAWRHFDQRTAEEGEKAKKVFFGKGKIGSSAAQDRQAGNYTRSVELSDVEQGGNLKHAEKASSIGNSNSSTQQRTHKQKSEEQKNDVQFGQPSPPRSTLRVSKQGEQNNTGHASRWASYGDLPASFCQTTASYPSATSVAKNEKLPEASKNTPRSAFDVMAGAAAADQHVRSSTLQIPSTPKQSKEHQPLLEMFWKQNAQRKGIEAKPRGKDYHPILDLYETQLQQLSASSQQKTSSTKTENEQVASGQQSPATDTSQADDEVAGVHPGDLLTLSIQSLLHGVGQLASAFKLTNSELQHQIELAQKDIPRNIEKALKSSLKALESLKASLPQAKVSPSSPQASKGTQAERPSTSDQATNTASALEQAFLNAKDDTIAALDSASSKLASVQPAEKEALSEVTRDYSGFNTAYLEKLLKDRSLSTSGKRSHMVARLNNHDPSIQIDHQLSPPPRAGKEVLNAEQEEAKRQNDRVDTVVESMRVELLNTGWKPDRRVYTRADLLEDFLASFISLRTAAEVKEEVPQASSAFISPMSVASAELAASAVPPVPSKVKDDDLPALERPYSWDMDYLPPKVVDGGRSEGLDLLTPSFEDVRPRIPLPCPRCALTFPDRGSLTWHVEQHDLKHDIEERKAYKFPTRDPLDEKWKPLMPQNAQAYAYRPYVFNPANVMEAPPMKYQPYYQESSEVPNFAPPLPSEVQQVHTAPNPVAELADDRVLERYPTISQLEHRRQAPNPDDRRREERPSAHVSFQEPPRAQEIGRHNKARNSLLSDLLHDKEARSIKRDEHQQRLSSRMSMPVMRSEKNQTAEPNAAPLYQDFPFQTSSTAKPTSALHKSASTSFRPAHPYEATSGLQRSNTTTGPSSKGQTNRPPAYKPYEPAKYRPATPGPTEQAGIKVADCKARLVEFGFDATHAANVSKLVKGDLEEAIDILEEDASVRKTWKGKSRAYVERRRHVPGAFDDEIYG